MKKLTATHRLAEIITELKFNLKNCIEVSTKEKTCEQVVNNFIEQLSEGEFSFSAIRRQLKSTEIKSLNDELIGKGCENLWEKTKYGNQHKVITLLLEKLRENGLSTGRSGKTGVFTLHNQDSISTVKQPRETKVKKSDKLTAKVGDLVAIDLPKYLELATKFLKSTEWIDNVIGVQMVIPRRNVEVGSMMDFYVDDTYSIVISTPAKKAEKDTFYLLPCLVNSSLIIDAIENIRNQKPELKSDRERKLGNPKKANAAFNNDENKRITKVYNQILRGFLPTDASIEIRDNFHQLKHIGTCALKQIKLDSLGGLIGQQKLIDEWITQAVAHKSTGITDEYINWNITNIPDELRVLADKEYGQVDSDYVGIEINQNKGDKMSELFSNLNEICSDNSDKLTIVKHLFLNEDGNIKQTNEVAYGINLILEEITATRNKSNRVQKSLGAEVEKTSTEERIIALVDAIILHNEAANNSDMIHISDSAIRGFYGVYTSDSNKPLSININSVKNIIRALQLNIKIDDHNAYKGLNAGQNLKWRRNKAAIMESIRKIIESDFPDVLSSN